MVSVMSQCVGVSVVTCEDLCICDVLYYIGASAVSGDRLVCLDHR